MWKEEVRIYDTLKVYNNFPQNERCHFWLGVNGILAVFFEKKMHQKY